MYTDKFLYLVDQRSFFQTTCNEELIQKFIDNTNEPKMSRVSSEFVSDQHVLNNTTHEIAIFDIKKFAIKDEANIELIAIIHEDCEHPKDRDYDLLTGDTEL